MPKTRVSCPQCRQPVVADLEQLFDVGADPSAKQRLLSGAFNLVQCSACGFQGNLASPLVYHDPNKELLLTFVPPELGLSRDDQERLIGSLINQVVNRLPQELRKGYLLRPQATLTMQGLVERVLEEDGITREMIQEQQKRLNLLQRLANLTDEKTLAEVARQEDALIDEEFFGLIRRLAEAALSSGDQQSGRRLAELQKQLLTLTTFGQKIQEQSQEVQAAMNDLRTLGSNLTQEKLLELVVHAPNETRLGALVSLARPAMDYTFFQLLSDRIDRAHAESRSRLVDLRAKLLEMTQEIDRQIEAHVQEVRKLIDMIAQQENVSEAMQQVMPAVDEYFVRELESALQQARQKGDLGLSAKYQQMLTAIQEANTPPPEVALLEEYLDQADDAARRQFLQSHAELVTAEFLEMLGGLAAQAQSAEDREFAERVRAANRTALRYAMEKNMGSD